MIAVKHVNTIVRNQGLLPLEKGVCVHPDSKLRVLAMTC